MVPIVAARRRRPAPADRATAGCGCSSSRRCCRGRSTCDTAPIGKMPGDARPVELDAVLGEVRLGEDVEEVGPVVRTGLGVADPERRRSSRSLRRSPEGEQRVRRAQCRAPSAAPLLLPACTSQLTWTAGVVGGRRLGVEDLVVRRVAQCRTVKVAGSRPIDGSCCDAVDRAVERGVESRGCAPAGCGTRGRRARSRRRSRAVAMLSTPNTARNIKRQHQAGPLLTVQCVAGVISFRSAIIRHSPCSGPAPVPAVRCRRRRRHHRSRRRAWRHPG